MMAKSIISVVAKEEEEEEEEGDAADRLSSLPLQKISFRDFNMRTDGRRCGSNVTRSVGRSAACLSSWPFFESVEGSLSSSVRLSVH